MGNKIVITNSMIITHLGVIMRKDTKKYVKKNESRIFFIFGRKKMRRDGSRDCRDPRSKHKKSSACMEGSHGRRSRIG